MGLKPGPRVIGSFIGIEKHPLRPALREPRPAIAYNSSTHLLIVQVA